MTTAVVTYPSGFYVNSDGLIVKYGKSCQIDAVVGKPTQYGVEQTLEADILWDRLPAFTADENHGMFLGGYPNNAIPAGALIKSCEIQVTTGEASAASQTLNVGLCQGDVAGAGATIIDGDGLIDALGQSSLDVVGETTAGAGALIGTKLATAGYLWVSVGTANFTTLVARLRVTYFMPDTDHNNT